MIVHAVRTARNVAGVLKIRARLLKVLSAAIVCRFLNTHFNGANLSATLLLARCWVDARHNSRCLVEFSMSYKLTRRLRA